MEKLRDRQVKEVVQGHTACELQSRSGSAVSLAPGPHAQPHALRPLALVTKWESWSLLGSVCCGAIQSLMVSVPLLIHSIILLNPFHGTGTVNRCHFYMLLNSHDNPKEKVSYFYLQMRKLRPRDSPGQCRGQLMDFWLLDQSLTGVASLGFPIPSKKKKNLLYFLGL